MSSPVLVSAAMPGAQPPRLLDQLRDAAFGRFARPEPGERYVAWVRRFILFHDKRHPRELEVAEAGQFLEHVAQSEKDPLGEILAEILAQCLHEISSVIRREATRSGGRMASVLSCQNRFRLCFIALLCANRGVGDPLSTRPGA